MKNTESNEIDVLFVCYANVARSQMAEGFYNSLGWGKALSAGIADYREKYNNCPHPDVVRVMAEIGVDISPQTMRLVTPELVDRSSIIAVLCKHEYLPDYLKDSKKVIRIEIDDPGAKMDGLAPVDEETYQKLRESRDAVKRTILEELVGQK